MDIIKELLTSFNKHESRQSKDELEMYFTYRLLFSALNSSLTQNMIHTRTFTSFTMRAIIWPHLSGNPWMSLVGFPDVSADVRLPEPNRPWTSEG